ncbi:MAG TPA: HEAT repeat domain-containing protein [Gemmatimonadaceae bacterium]|nr:HEAT repeat domain-containing protein [Gemmatimonadaceae bacterium]
MISALRLTMLLLGLPTAGAGAAQVAPRAPREPAVTRPAPTPRPERAPRPPAEARPPRPDGWHELELPTPRVHVEPPDVEFHLPSFERHAEEFAWRAAELETRRAELDARRAELSFRELPAWTPEPPHALAPLPAELPHFETPVPVQPPLVPFELERPLRATSPRPFFDERYREPFATRPRAPWLQEDPADSLYKLGYQLLNRGEWRRAAAQFAVIPQRFPSSGYAADALYWQAFALYRIGSTDDLKAALQSLETLRTRYPSAKTQSDAATLTTRIRSTLASRGDREAEEALRRTMGEQAQARCDREDMAVRAEALKGLAQTDPASLPATVRRVLARKDSCSAPLRRQAVYLLGQSGDAEGPAILRDVALNDTESEVRSAAIQYLARSGSDVAVSTLEEILRTSTDQSTLRSAARALAANPNPRAKQAVRALIERSDAPERLRIEAVAGFENSERTTEEDATYLRNVYTKIDNPRVKARIARVLGHLGGETNDQWLLGLMRNSDEPVEVRTAALSRVASRNMPIADAVRLYANVSDRQMRERLINIYGQRREAEATDKLLDIAKNDTDHNLRRQAIQALTRKNDPRATKLLLEIIDK